MCEGRATMVGVVGELTRSEHVERLSTDTA